jgi:hypothetical protein
MIVVKRLLKSWAMPPASSPMASNRPVTVVLLVGVLVFFTILAIARIDT